ncbi:MAG: hypothetical protein WC244_02855 [Patescibacteria group bacterium]|jgi:hypothetical protein
MPKQQRPTQSMSPDDQKALLEKVFKQVIVTQSQTGNSGDKKKSNKE